jgi:NAD(P)H-flavin reductase
MATATVAEQHAVGPMVPVPFTVSAREQNTADTWTVTLEPVVGEAPSVAPGQFMMVTVFGIGEVPISVSGPPNRVGPVVLTVRDVGAVTRAVCAAGERSVLGLRGPFGNHWPVESALGGDVIVIAGGIGLAPLRPVVLAVLERRDRFGAVRVLYGARTPADLLYTGELDEWRRRIAVDVTVDTAGAEWSGRVGVVTKLLGEALARPQETTAFLCGPEIMMRFAARALLDRGVDPSRIAVSLERHMDCGVGLCGHCQLGPTLICRDGPVYAYSTVEPWFEVREL